MLQRMRGLVPLLAASPRLQRKLMQHCLTLFGSDERGPSLQALLLIRQMALLLPEPALDLALKVGPCCLTPQSSQNQPSISLLGRLLAASHCDSCKPFSMERSW